MTNCKVKTYVTFMSGAYEILFTSLRCAFRLLLPAPLPMYVIESYLVYIVRTRFVRLSLA